MAIRKKTIKEPTSKARNIQTDVKKLKILFTIVNRSKAAYYIDILEDQEVNLQLVIYGRGTATNQMMDLLGIAESDKAVILSVIKEDKVSDIMSLLAEKFNKNKNSKGIAYTVPLQSVIGASIYQFLSNNKTMKREEKSNG